MATAKKLPSGSWRCLVYSHSEPVYDLEGKPVFKNGKPKMKRIYESFTSNIPGPKGKREAERQAALFAAEKESLPRSDLKTLTVGEAMNQYIENRSSVLSPGTIREYKRCRKNDIQQLMQYKISEITQEDIQIAINHASLNHSPKSVRNIHGLLSAVLRTYRPNFALNTKLPQKIRPELYIPKDSDIQRLIQYLNGSNMEIPVLLAAFGPLRRGEICALNYEDISGNMIHISKSLVMDENKKWIIKPPKTFTSDRFVQFPDFVIKKIGRGTGRIISLNPNALSNRFSRILKEADITHFRFHDLRHYCASIQHALGIPDAYIMQRGGWASDAILKNVYRHALDDRSQKMNDLANDHFAKLYNTKCNTEIEI